MITVSSTDARAALPALLDRVLAGEEVTITRHGQPVAVVVRPDALRSRRADQVLAAAARVEAALETGRATPLTSSPGLTAERAEELLAEVRAGRMGRSSR